MALTWNFMDRRRALRVPFRAATFITDVESGQVKSASTRDLSTHGCFVENITSCSPGTKVWIWMAFDGVNVGAEANVVHVCAQGMGVNFSKIEISDQVFVDRWMSQMRKVLRGPK
jgi:hypothetical protein